MSSEQTAKIASGLKLISMSMSDAETGKCLWQADWSNVNLINNTKEESARIPKEILKCSSVTRDLVFSSAELINNFKVVQRVLLHNNLIEEWDFEFGFVIPGSTNTWSSTVDADPRGTLPPEIISGNIVIETIFYDGANELCKTAMRIYYV